MAIIADGKRYACTYCRRGHRSSSCTHADRHLVLLSRGRPRGKCRMCKRPYRCGLPTCTCEAVAARSIPAKEGRHLPIDNRAVAAVRRRRLVCKQRAAPVVLPASMIAPSMAPCQDVEWPQAFFQLASMEDFPQAALPDMFAFARICPMSDDWVMDISSMQPQQQLCQVSSQDSESFFSS